MANLHCEAIAFPSSDGKHTSSAFLYTVPGQPVRAVLQLSHGMCEYVRRYAPMAEFYAAHGIALAGNDHLGHGDTAQTGEHGHYGEPNGRCHLLNDLHTMNTLSCTSAFPIRPSSSTATAWAAFTRAGMPRSGRKASRHWSFPARQAPAL